jgi:hypothetical protein
VITALPANVRQVLEQLDLKQSVGAQARRIEIGQKPRHGPCRYALRAIERNDSR